MAVSKWLLPYPLQTKYIADIKWMQGKIEALSSLIIADIKKHHTQSSTYSQK